MIVGELYSGIPAVLLVQSHLALSKLSTVMLVGAITIVHVGEKVGHHQSMFTGGVVPDSSYKLEVAFNSGGGYAPSQQPISESQSISPDICRYYFITCNGYDLTSYTLCKYHEPLIIQPTLHCAVIS